MVLTSLLAGAARNWWVLALRGVAAVLFAIFAFIWPGLTLTVLVLLWGAFAFFDGIFAIVTGASSRWWSLLFFGVLGVLAGLVAFFMPGLTAFALVLLIAAWAIVRGVLEIVAAIQLRKELTGEWLLALGGIFSILFGILIMLFPGPGALAVVWLIALQAFVVGILELVLAFRLRRIHKHGGPVRVDLPDETPAGPGIGA